VVGRIVRVHRQAAVVEAHLALHVPLQVPLQAEDVDVLGGTHCSAGACVLVRRDHAGGPTEAHRSEYPGRCCSADSVNSWSFSLAPLVATPTFSGSSTKAFAVFLAISVFMCGGTGGISGSTTTSSTTGPSVASARSHAGPISSGLSQ